MAKEDEISPNYFEGSLCPYHSLVPRKRRRNSGRFKRMAKVRK